MCSILAPRTITPRTVKVCITETTLTEDFLVVSVPELFDPKLSYTLSTLLFDAPLVQLLLVTHQT